MKRGGAAVAADAMGWLQKNSSSPVFLFLHLYDLHTPRSRGYEGELEYVDGVLGKFFSFLARIDLLEKSLVVFTSDHGEKLGRSWRIHPRLLHLSEHSPCAVDYSLAARHCAI